jgi:LPS-assembly lipoprotein
LLEERKTAMKLNRSLHVTAIAVLLSVLPACGFHLRGDVELPPVLKETYLESNNPYTGMARALRVELEAAGGRIVESSEGATAVLHIVREASENRILSVGSTGKASEYELFNEVVFSLSDAQDKVLIQPQSLRMTRDLVFDETELLGKVSEAEGIHRQMRRNLARQIIIRIGAGLRQQ